MHIIQNARERDRKRTSSRVEMAPEKTSYLLGEGETPFAHKGTMKK